MNPLSLSTSSILLVLLIVGSTFLSVQPMHYQEPLNIEELESIFGHEDCIDGTLSATATIQSPFFTKSENSITLEGVQTNATVIDEKSPISAINELAQFHQIAPQYVLTHEDGPAHKKTFGVSLTLGEENYFAEGGSIKKAQREAARLALNSTSYKQPPKSPKKDFLPQPNKTPVQKLEDWAKKHGELNVVYSFIQQSKLGWDHSPINHYHKGMYSMAKDMCRATVIIENERYEGEGFTQDEAKRNAASNALKQLQNTKGFCMLSDNAKSLFNRILNYNSDYSPISLVTEFASTSKISVSFDLTSEEGPAHIKNFVYKCSVDGGFESFGEGSSKKEAKTMAAENMVKKLQLYATRNELKCGGVVNLKKSKKRKSSNLVKSVANSYHEEKDDSEYSVPDAVNPISKLFQIQQWRHDAEPVFKFVEEKGHPHKEFVMEVSIGDISFLGSGRNKKAAKRNAAEGMLKKLGYASETMGARSYSSEHKKEQFIDGKTYVEKKPLAPGLVLNLETFFKLDEGSSEGKPGKQNDKRPQVGFSTESKTQAKSNSDDSKKHFEKKLDESKSQKMSSHKSPKSQLEDLSQTFGFRIQFSYFPSKFDAEFISLVSMTTDPPKVCKGMGGTTTQSQDQAALAALEFLYKSQLHSLSMLKQPSSERLERLHVTGEENAIKTIIHGKTTE